MATTFGLALVGCGPVGRRYAIAARDVRTLRIALCVDDQAARAAEVASDVGAIPATMDGAVGTESIDGLIITADAGDRAELVATAARAGRHVLVHAPIGLTRASAKAAARAAARANTLLLVGFPWRFAAPVELARRLMHEPRVAAGQMFGDGAFGVGCVPDGRPGEGALWSSGIHFIDLLAFVMKSRPERVQAFGGALVNPGAQVVDSAVCAFVFPGGRIASLTISASPSAGAVGDPYLELSDGARRIVLTDGLRAAELAGYKPNAVTAAAPAVLQVDRSTSEVRARERNADDPIVAQLRAFATALETGRLPDGAAGPVDGQAATAVVCSVLDAVRTGVPRRLRLP